MLTKKQHELLIFIHKSLKNEGISPSFEEMKKALKLKSKSGIHRLINGLEDRGFIKRLPNRARALEVVKLPENREISKNSSTSEKNVIEGNFQKIPKNDYLNTAEINEENLQLPFLGKIAAGLPIEAINNPTEIISIPSNFVKTNDAHYALEIEGDSMIEAGILDGDTAIIRSTNTSEDGQIVVALVDENESTIKRLRRKGSSVALEAANPVFETRIFGPDRVKIQGILVGILRQYN